MEATTKIKAKTKKCARKTCLKTKPIDQFPSDKREHDKHSVWCKSCWSEYQKARKALKAGPNKKVVAKNMTKAKSAAKKIVKALKPVKEAN